MTAMHPFIRSLLILVFSLLGICALPAGAAPAEPVEADRIVAVVGDEVITYYDLRVRLDAALKQLQKQGTNLPPQDVLERQMLERVIMDRIQLQLARESGLRVDDNQLDQAIGRIATSNKMTQQQFRVALEKDGINYARFREEIRAEMTMTRLREREVDSKLVISDGEIDLYLANQVATGGGEEFQLAHILLRAPESASPEALQKLRLRGEQALKRAKAGENFAELTATYSDAPDALQGGSLGWRQLDRLPTLYAETAVRLQPGETRPVLLPCGLHQLLPHGRQALRNQARFRRRGTPGSPGTGGPTGFRGKAGGRQALGLIRFRRLSGRRNCWPASGGCCGSPTRSCWTALPPSGPMYFGTFRRSCWWRRWCCSATRPAGAE